MRRFKYITFSLLFLANHLAFAADGKLIATPGVSQIEGSGGGGLVPWAQLAGYASRDEVDANVFCSSASITDFQLDACGGQFNLYDRVELSAARQRFRVNALDTDINQDIIGAKVRLYGDLVYSEWPMVSLGVQHKSLRDPAIAKLLGAKSDSGNDVYLAISKLNLAAVAGYNLFWNVTTRYTDANQIGLLGFGAQGKHKKLQLEASTAILFGRHLAAGLEYRQKPNNLSTREDDWKDIFLAWFPNKTVSLTAAWLDLGHIAGFKKQTGFYLSATGYF